jgi:hypothetical protein
MGSPPPAPMSQPAARRLPTTSTPSNPDWTSRLGFWFGLLAAGISVVFSIASVPVLLGSVGPPWDNVLTLVPSLLLAPTLLVLLVCVDTATPEQDRIWTRLAVAFAGIYVALVSVVYVVELAVVEPLIVSGHADRAGLLTIDPGGTLNAVDGLGYTFLGLALLWLAPLFHGTRLKRWTRWSLVANGIAIVPIVLTYFVDRGFIAVTAPIWAIAIPASSLLLALSFRRLTGASRSRRGHHSSPPWISA